MERRQGGGLRSTRQRRFRADICEVRFRTHQPAQKRVTRALAQHRQLHRVPPHAHGRAKRARPKLRKTIPEAFRRSVLPQHAFVAQFPKTFLQRGRAMKLRLSGFPARLRRGVSASATPHWQPLWERRARRIQPCMRMRYGCPQLSISCLVTRDAVGTALGPVFGGAFGQPFEREIGFVRAAFESRGASVENREGGKVRGTEAHRRLLPGCRTLG